MTKPFTTPFAENGDVMFIPETAQADGSVSYETGFGPDYSADPLEANAKPVPRAGHNELFNQITGSIGDIQRQGAADWYQEFADDGGYPKNAVVWDQGDRWKSQIDGNTTRPSVDEIAWLPSAKFEGGGGSGGGGSFGLIGPTTINVGGSYNYTIDPFSSFMTYAVSATNGTATVSGPTITLVIAAGETSNVTDLTVTRSDGVSADFRIAIGAQSIAKPSILSPVTGATDVPLGPTLVASAFATYPSGADTHLNSDWRIRTMAGAVVWQSLANAANKTTIQVPDNTLPLNTQLQADVRYRGTTLPVSAYSDPVVFTTTNQSITTPTITSPLNGATGINGTPTITASAFSTNPLGADTHASSDWRLKNSTGTIIWSSVADTVNKTSITIPSGILAVSSQYTIEVRYNGAVLQPSQWSPVVSFTTAATFDYGKYLAVGTSIVPRMPIYGQDIDTFVRLPDPVQVPAGQVQCVSFSPNGDYLGCCAAAASFHIMYKRTGDTFASITGIGAQSGTVTEASWSPDSVYYAIGFLANTPRIRIYKRDGDVFTALATPATLPTAAVSGVAFSGTGNYLAVSFAGGTKVIVYKRAGDVFTALSTSLVIGGDAQQLVWSSDDTYLSVASSTTPFVQVFKRSGDTFTLLTAPATLPAGNGQSVAFTTGATYMAVGHANSPFVTIYKRSGDTFTKVANPATLPTGAASSLAFTADTNQLMVGNAGSTPFITLYRRSGDVFSKLANPAVLPGGIAFGIAVYPPTLGI